MAVETIIDHKVKNEDLTQTWAVLQIAEKGLENAAADNIAILRGINLFDGRVTNRAVAETHGLKCHEF